jgi:uncharacterized protein (UPF0332 family)
MGVATAEAWSAASPCGAAPGDGYIRRMPAPATASLSAVERGVLDRYVNVLRDGLGDDLRAVWLYGSRARGDAVGPESDVDVMVIARQATRYRSRRYDLLFEADPPPTLRVSVILADPSWVARQRAIGGFFIGEVDRDRIALYGDGWDVETPAIEPRSADGMSPRSEEFMETARVHLEEARAAVELAPNLVVGGAYSAMLNAARAALSERDLYAKTHDGTWNLFFKEFVEPGLIDRALHQRATRAQQAREDVDYRAVPATVDGARDLVAVAERFLAAVEAEVRQPGA